MDQTCRSPGGIACRPHRPQPACREHRPCPADSCQSGFARKDFDRLLDAQAELLHHVQHGEHIQVAGAVVVRQTDCGEMPKLVSMATPSRIAAMLELPPRWQEMWRIFAAAEQFLSLFAGRAVAGAVKSVAADAVLLLPLVRDGKSARLRPMRIEERGFEQARPMAAKESAAERAHRGHVRRIVSRREERRTPPSPPEVRHPPGARRSTDRRAPL